MYQQRRWARNAEEQETANRQTASLAGVAITLLLLVLGLFLVRALHQAGGDRGLPDGRAQQLRPACAHPALTVPTASPLETMHA